MHLITKRQDESELLSINDSYVIRGIAIIAVIIHHFSQFYNVGSFFQFVLGEFGYLAVGTFFFLSGYGNFISIKKRTLSKKQILFWGINRVITIVLAYLIVLICSVIVFLICGMPLDLNASDILTLTLPTWINWYLKIQVLLYIMYTIVNLITDRHEVELILSFVIICGYILFAKYFNIPNYWWNSVFCYFIGLFFAKNKERLIKYFNVYFAIICLILFIGFTYLKRINNIFGITACICWVFLCIGIAKVISVQSNILKELGMCSLVLYMAHLIVLRVLLRYEVNIGISLILLFVISILVSFLLNKVCVFIQKKIYIRK